MIPVSVAATSVVIPKTDIVLPRPWPTAGHRYRQELTAPLGVRECGKLRRAQVSIPNLLALLPIDETFVTNESAERALSTHT